MIQPVVWSPPYLPASTAATAATNAETLAGTNSAKFTTPASLKYAAQFLVAPVVNGRNPRQGLVWDGTNGPSTNVNAVLQTVVGTGALTVAMLARVPATPNANAGLWSISASVDTWDTNYAALVSGGLDWNFNSSGYVLTVANFVSNYAGKEVALVFVRNGTTATIYIDGIVAATATHASVGVNITGTRFRLGNTANDVYNDIITPIGVYNRAFSDSDALALYLSGMPEYGDYGATGVPASNTSVVTGNDSTFASATGFWTLNHVSIAAGKATFDGDTGAYIRRLSLLTVGKRYRLTFVTSGRTTGTLGVYDGVSYISSSITTNGAQTLEFVATGTALYFINAQGASPAFNGAIDDVLLYPIGLLCAPELTAPGNGYQWHDMSGNSADLIITSPNVTWAFPDNRANFVRGTLSWSGTHEQKSLVATFQRLIPIGAVITLLTRVSTAATSGTGCIIGTTNSGTRWQSFGALTVGETVGTIANQFPASTSDSDNDVVVDPDNAAFTGSITVKMHYAFVR